MSMNTDQITLEEALRLVEFERCFERWTVKNVRGDVRGDVEGYVLGDVEGSVGGNVLGDVLGDVGGTIGRRKWQFVETPSKKLKRLIEEEASKDELLAVVDQLIAAELEGD